MNVKKKKNKTEKLEYPVFQARLNQEMIDWLKGEKQKFNSWNKFFNEIINRYELPKINNQR
jgi:hypothetical protein